MGKKFCDMCGCPSYNGACTNCHEEIYIEDQYYELELPPPESILKRTAIQRAEIEQKRRRDTDENP